MKRIDDCRLYGIIDLGYVAPANLVRMALDMVEGGVDIVQLRAKHFIPDDVRWFAEQVHPVTSAAKVPLVINDYPDVASGIGAEGVHVGQDDMNVERARELAGYRTMIGKSSHSLAQATAAAAEDTDYIAFGPIFSTPTKPDYAPVGLDEIRAVHDAVKKPVFCIGGIKLENIGTVIQAGARRIVIVSGILHAENVVEYCKKAKAMLA